MAGALQGAITAALQGAMVAVQPGALRVNSHPFNAKRLAFIAPKGHL